MKEEFVVIGGFEIAEPFWGDVCKLFKDKEGVQCSGKDYLVTILTLLWDKKCMLLSLDESEYVDELERAIYMICGYTQYYEVYCVEGKDYRYFLSINDVNSGVFTLDL